MTVSPYIAKEAQRLGLLPQGRILNSIAGSASPVRYEDYHFLRTSSPGSWDYRKPMPRSWLQLAARIASIAVLCAGACLIWGK